MPAELRKRKEPSFTPAPASVPKKRNPVAKVVEKVENAITGVPKGASSSGRAGSNVAVGETINLDDFGGEVEFHDGMKTTLHKLVEESKGGVVLFTYPKASTPGCTTQVCLFRDSYDLITSAGYSVYGLSKDSPKANTSFKEKQKLPYPLLCDPSATLISAIGMRKAPSGTTRGVFAVDKAGKVLAAEPGGPAATLEVIKTLIGSGKSETSTAEPAAPSHNANGSTKDDVVRAETAPSHNANGSTKDDTVRAETAPSHNANGSTKDDVVRAETAPSHNANGSTKDDTVRAETAPSHNANGSTKDDIIRAETAAEVADTAEKLDSEEAAADDL